VIEALIREYDVISAVNLFSSAPTGGPAGNGDAAALVPVS
jgi:hypothetical protein